MDLLDLPPIDAAAVADGPGPIELRKAGNTAIVTFEQFAVAPLEAIRAGLVALANRYDRVAFDLTTPKGLEEAKAARHDLRENGRYAVQRAGEKFKKDANAAKKKADALVIELAAIVEPVEDRLDKIIKARELELEAEKEAKRQADEARKQRHRDAIATIRSYLTHAQQPGMTSERIARGMSALASMPKIGPETFEEFADEAAAAYAETFNAMHALHERVLGQEMEAAELARQREEQDRIAREQAERQRVLDEQAAALARQREEIEAAQQRAISPAAPAAPEGKADPGPGTAEAAPFTVTTTVRTVPGALVVAGGDAVGSAGSFGGAGSQADDSAAAPTYTPPGTHSAPAAPATAVSTIALTTGAINERLGLTLTSAFITGTLKVKPDGTSKQQTPLWNEAKFRTICAALAEHVLCMAERHSNV